MCLTANAKKVKTGRGKYDYRYIKPEWVVARRNIPVFKVLQEESDGYVGPFRNQFTYTANTSVKSRLTMGHRFNRYSYVKPSLVTVNVGLHASVSLQAAKNLARRCCAYDETMVVVQMTIPKGAKYLRGVNKDIVSNKLETGPLKVLFRHREDHNL